MIVVVAVSELVVVLVTAVFAVIAVAMLNITTAATENAKSNKQTDQRMVMVQKTMQPYTQTSNPQSLHAYTATRTNNLG